MTARKLEIRSMNGKLLDGITIFRNEQGYFENKSTKRFTARVYPTGNPSELINQFYERIHKSPPSEDYKNAEIKLVEDKEDFTMPYF